MRLSVDIIKTDEKAIIPKYQTEGAAGFDFHITGSYNLRAGERRLLPTGLKMKIPKGFELQIRSRSGMAFKHGIIVLNQPGTIDSDYRGEIQILVFNSNEHGSFLIEDGERIAQGVISPVIQVDFTEVETLDTTQRGEGGFGHTGKA